MHHTKNCIILWTATYEINYMPWLRYRTIWSNIVLGKREHPWPSGDELDFDQRGPGFEAHRRPLVTPGRASGPKCSRQNNSPLRGTLQVPRN